MYVTFEVMEPLWAAFEAKVKTASSLDEVGTLRHAQGQGAGALQVQPAGVRWQACGQPCNFGQPCFV